MKRFIILSIIAFTGLLLGVSTNEASGALASNNPFVLEGSGYAVTDDQIKISLINFDLTTGSIANTRGTLTIDNGFITINDDDFSIDNLRGTVLRDGRFLRISGTTDGLTGDDLSFSLFGKLIQETNIGSIYSFSGKANLNDETYKVIYTSQLSKFSSIKTPITSTPEKQNEITIKIFKGASTKAVAANYIEALGSKSLSSGQGSQQSYISMDRITIKPGTTIKWVNDDTVSHRITSGEGLGSNARGSQSNVKICDESTKLKEGSSYKQSDCTFTLDGRIDTGVITPGESISVTITEPGFYRFTNPDYLWVNGVIYAFENVSTNIDGSKNQKLN